MCKDNAPVERHGVDGVRMAVDDVGGLAARDVPYKDLVKLKKDKR